MGKDCKVIFDNLALSITRRSVSSHPYDVEMYIADDHLCSMSGLVHMTSAEALALANAIYDDLGMGLDTDLAKAQAEVERLRDVLKRLSDVSMESWDEFEDFRNCEVYELMERIATKALET